MINLKSMFKFWKGRDGKKPIRVSKDPVCGMEASADLFKADYKNKSYYFCSDHCQQQFKKDPETYITK